MGFVLRHGIFPVLIGEATVAETNNSEKAASVQRLHQIGAGYWVSQALYVAAKLGVSDALADGPRPVEELAAIVGADAGALFRLLRALAGYGLFTQTTPRCFGLTELGQIMRSDVPGSMRALAMRIEWDWRTWEHMLYSVRTGRTAFEHIYGESFFEHLQRHPERAAVFDEAMTVYVKAHGVAVASAYDFSPFGTIVDVGGGHGAMMQAILLRYPRARGVLFDLPRVIVGAREAIDRAGLSARCRCVGGDFFAGVPNGEDGYLLSSILHDWDHQRSLTILRNCRRAMPEHARLLIVEMVIPEGDEPFFGKLVDLQMLVTLGGLERTAKEYQQLLVEAGFELIRIIPTQSPASLLEAAPA